MNKYISMTSLYKNSEEVTISKYILTIITLLIFSIAINADAAWLNIDGCKFYFPNADGHELERIIDDPNKDIQIKGFNCIDGYYSGRGDVFIFKRKHDIEFKIKLLVSIDKGKIIDDISLQMQPLNLSCTLSSRDGDIYGTINCYNKTEKYYFKGISELNDGNMTIYYNDGSKFVGYIDADFHQEGLFRRSGSFFLSNGGKFEGNFVLGNDSSSTVINGNGTYTFKDGSSYQGLLANGYLSGEGIYTWPNGERFEGDFDKNIRTGKGKYYTRSRLLYEGDFINGNFEGYGTYYYTNAKFIGPMKNDKPNGKGKLIFDDGQNQEGNFVNGDREGTFHVTYADGDTDVQTFKHDKLISSRNNGTAQGLAALALVLGAVKKVSDGVGNAISSSSSSSSSGYSGSSYPTCNYREEDCFKIIETKWDDNSYTDYYIECTKGKKIGSKECISVWKKDGTWKDGCGITTYYRYDRRKAGNMQCGEY